MSGARPRTRDDGAHRVSLGFMVAYVGAQLGAFLSFIPVIAILLPLKAQAIAPAGKAEVLSGLLIAGAVTASLSNILIGWLGDRGRRRGQSRGGLLIVGAIGLALSLLGLGRSQSVPALTAAYVSLQVCINAVLSPLTAVLADQVPVSHKRRLAGWLSLGHPLAALLGAPLVGVVIVWPPARYPALAALMLIGVLPFAFWLLKAAPTDEPPVAPSAIPGGRRTWRHADFQRLWLSRLLMQCAMAPVSTYLLFYLEDVHGRRHDPEAAVAVLTALSTLASAFAGPVFGHVSERLDRARLGFATGVAMAGGLALLCLASVPPLPAMVLIGLGYGGYTTLDIALASEIVARLRTPAQDLGLLNLAYTLPQISTPVFAGVALRPGAGYNGYALLFGTAAACAILAGWALASASSPAAGRP